MSVIGIDLGGTKVAAALFGEDGGIIAKESALLGGAEGEKVAEKVTAVVKALLDNEKGVKVDAIGVCVPGIVYSKTDTVWAPNIPGWDNFPLKKYLAENLALKDVEVCIESDRTCYILGEVWKGAAKGCSNAIYLAVGTGIGAGILLDGHIIHGASDIVGATGWMALEGPYTHEFDQCGCFETYASGNGIGYQAKKIYRDSSKTSYDVFADYRKDPIATEILDKAIRMWGMGAANLVSLFNPEKIVFGGGVFGPAAEFIPRIYEEACKWGQPISMKQVEFCATTVGTDAALLGSAYLAIKSLSDK